jgi:hypothetical protein
MLRLSLGILQWSKYTQKRTKKKYWSIQKIDTPNYCDLFLQLFYPSVCHFVFHHVINLPYTTSLQTNPNNILVIGLSHKFCICSKQFVGNISAVETYLVLFYSYSTSPGNGGIAQQQSKIAMLIQRWWMRNRSTNIINILNSLEQMGYKVVTCGSFVVSEVKVIKS